MNRFINNTCRPSNIFNFLFSKNVLLLSAFLSIAGYLHGQDSVKIIPDGTQGEFLEISDSVSSKEITFKNWNQFDGPLSTLTIGGGLLYDYATYSQDETAKHQMDSANVTLKPDFKLRDFRVTASGQFKFYRPLTWKAGFMYDGASSSWYMRETGIMIGVPELSGHIFLGRTKEGFSLNKVMVGYAGWTMERQMAIDVIPILADGIKWIGFLPEQRIVWNAGAYIDWLSKSQSFSTYHWQLAARIGFLPVYSEEDNTVIHIGINFRYGKTAGGTIRLRSRPEANPAPYFIDTKEFNADHSNHLGGELYFSFGSWMLGTEYYAHQFSSSETDNPVFHGGEAVISYIFNNGVRPYSTISGIYTFVPVAKSFFEGGSGTWEALIRISNFDLDGGTITGGKFWKLTPMVNWYLSKNVRLEFAYGYGVLKRFKLEGVTQFFQSRIQLSL